ncbi:MAG: flagellar hook-length control protein FliK, partial [Candidatus Hydrogenedentota bacterium]
DAGRHGAESAPELEHGADAMLKVLSQATKPGEEAGWIVKALQALREQGGRDIEPASEARTSLEALLQEAAELDEQKPPRSQPSEGEAERPLEQLVPGLPREVSPMESGEGVTGFESSSTLTDTLAPLETARPAPKATPSFGAEEAKPPQPPPADVSGDKPTRDLWWAALRPVDADSAREETRLRFGDSFRHVTRETLFGRKMALLPHAADPEGSESFHEAKNIPAPFSSRGGPSAQAAPAEGRALFLTPETAVSSKEGAPRGNQSGSWNLSTAVQEPGLGVARSEATASPHGAARTETQDLQQSVIQSVRYLASRGERSLSVRLKPESLGELRITLTTAHDRIQVQLFTGNAAVRESLEAQLPQLRESLTRDGFDVMRLSVETDSSGGNAAEGGHPRAPMHDLLNQRQGGRSVSTLGSDTGEGSAGSTSPRNTTNRITDQTIDVRI